jgi:hypothetical protein
VDRGGDYYRNADHDRSDYQPKSGVVILFDLAMDVENAAQYEISDREKEQADYHEDQGRDQDLGELVKPNNKPQDGWSKKIHQHLLSSAKS